MPTVGDLVIPRGNLTWN
uniref:Mediator of RNA polymerase II transcription subunit 15a-like isoform X9 n=1 Tax=Rhizophora mucronata TaxID=61149 RepID=A0A2P2MQJ8_RHIMU